MKRTPAVQIVHGALFVAASASATAATKLVQSQVAERLKFSSAKKQASLHTKTVGVFAIPGRPFVLVGICGPRSPQIGETPLLVSPSSPAARVHPIVSAFVNLGPGLDSEGEVTLGDEWTSVLEALCAHAGWPFGEYDPTLAFEGITPANDEPPNAPRAYLVGDEGMTGDVVAGVVHWRDGDDFSGGRVRTWRRSLSDDMGIVRLIGVPVASVDAATPIVALPMLDDLLELRKELTTVVDTPTPSGWWLVS